MFPFSTPIARASFAAALGIFGIGAMASAATPSLVSLVPAEMGLLTLLIGGFFFVPAAPAGSSPGTSFPSTAEWVVELTSSITTGLESATSWLTVNGALLWVTLGALSIFATAFNYRMAANPTDNRRIAHSFGKDR
jgi:hypothetical protein